ncbi:unnamed protein product [Pseudo-nitzschia multistriata]|uniref:Uncharacterized protein n=1 Tax=Pseudo-nitzschia multistriata TaxID=183589 RepID=A0A448YYJ2_9STRA|nr:unnamed protein product [Pseudo-nitzschia multistriata]
MTYTTTRPSSKSSSSVFDRLYSKSTESSRLRQSAGKETTSKTIISKKKESQKHRARPVLKTKTNLVQSGTSAGSSAVYDRLYSKGTASYNSKRKTCSTKDERNVSGDCNSYSK